MLEVKSCGVLVMRRKPELSFLLMRHADRWDLPKGHVDRGESDLQCALRELHEETGITPHDIELDKPFLFETQYTVRLSHRNHEPTLKTLRIFLGWLKRDSPIQLSEHIGFEWFRWSPPHHIQPNTIDSLLDAVEKYLRSTPLGSASRPEA